MLSQILVEQGKQGTQLAVIIEQLKAIPDHESRIRKLEQWRYGLPLAGVMALGSMALTVWGLLNH